MGLRSTTVQIARPGVVRRQSVSTKESLRWRSTRSRLSDLWACPIIAQSLLARGYRPPLPPAENCPPVNRDHAHERECKSEFCFAVGNETRNPPGHGHSPIKCWRVACAQVAKKPNRKSGCVNRPADALNIWHPTPQRTSHDVVATSRASHHSPGLGQGVQHDCSRE
jgi:hypothetical protein